MDWDVLYFQLLTVGALCYDGVSCELCFSVLAPYDTYVANVPVTFFNATHQVKAITIGISNDNPMAELVDCSDPSLFRL